MTDDDRWRENETPATGPSRPPDLHFNPLATAIGVFTAVAAPIVLYGYTRPAGTKGTIIALGVVIGLLVGIIAGIWVAHRGGRVWRGPQL